MKKSLIALLLSLTMMLGAFPVLGEPAAPSDPALATVNGVDILKSEVDRMIPVFINNQYIADETDYATVLDALIQRNILQKKAADLGFDQFSQEELDAFEKEATAQWDSAMNSYADYYQSEDTEEAREAALKQAEDMFLAEGMSKEILAGNLRESAVMDRLAQYLTGDYQPSEEEVQGVFSQYGAIYQETYQNDIAQYEYMTRFAGQTSWYTPEGYRCMIHILLSADEALLKEFQSLNARFEEQKGEAEAEAIEGGEAEPDSDAFPQPPVTQEMLDAARQAVLDSRKVDIDLINERLGRGESFMDLIREYGTDPGMKDEAALAEGYPVHIQSVVYEPAFVAAAFSEKMKQPGDVSDPVVGSRGIHILMYLRDLPSGLIMTDAIRQEIEDYLISSRMNEAFSTAYAQWLAQEQVTYHQDEIDKAVAEASKNAVSPEEEPLEAVTDDKTDN